MVVTKRPSTLHLDGGNQVVTKSPRVVTNHPTPDDGSQEFNHPTPDSGNQEFQYFTPDGGN